MLTDSGLNTLQTNTTVVIIYRLLQGLLIVNHYLIKLVFLTGVWYCHLEFSVTYKERKLNEPGIALTNLNCLGPFIKGGKVLFNYTSLLTKL